ncbi:EEF1A lysine methyltransferase 3-like, partial [Neopelma chrysocephalum]|uniref:EEF1A lysine methyltransferase 3-like n=1 Tax=Neopelma chrysocephalum TaxID=114329 RepID=UPI000FCD1AC0
PGAGAEVTLTDRPAALPQLRENVRQNFPGGSPEGVAGGAPRVRALCWGRDQRRFPPKFHLVLGSDIVYDPRAFAPLLGTLRHLVAPPGRALLSARRRGGGRGDPSFLRADVAPVFSGAAAAERPRGGHRDLRADPPGGGRGGGAARGGLGGSRGGLNGLEGPQLSAL